jgi:hypothetical protein
MPEIIEKVIEIEKPSAALELLEDIDVDNLSPREALQQLICAQRSHETAKLKSLLSPIPHRA